MMSNARSSRICLVTFKLGFSSWYPSGGVERFLEYYSDFLSRKRVRFTIVSPEAVSVKPFRLPFVGFLFYSLVFPLIAGIEIVSINRSCDFSLIHSIECGYAGLAGLFASKVLKKPFVIHVHCCRAKLNALTLSLERTYPKGLISLYEKYETLVDKLVFGSADVIVAVSNDVKQYILSLGVPTAKVFVRPPFGISMESYKFRAKNRKKIRADFVIPPDDFVVGYIGRLDPAKGVDTLIGAFSLFEKRHGARAKLHLLIVGEGHRRERERLEKMVMETGSPSVIFSGFRENVEEILSAIDVFVLPSFSEGFPIALLEAMAAGRAIVATDISSLREIVHDEQEALLFSPGDTSALEKALLRLYGDSELREELGKNARKKASQYDINSIFNGIVDLYCAVAQTSALDDDISFSGGRL